MKENVDTQSTEMPQPEDITEWRGPNRQQRRARERTVVKKPHKDISQQRAKSKQAKQARKKNR